MSLEVVFFLVMVALSVLDAIRKKKKGHREGGEATPLPGTETWPAPSDQPEILIPQSRTEDEARVTGESMIPKDLWEEIAALARGEGATGGPESDPDLESEPEPDPPGLDQSVFKAPPPRPGRSAASSRRPLERAPLSVERSPRDSARSRAPRSRAFRHEIAAEQDGQVPVQSWWEERPESDAILSARLGATEERAAAGHPYLQGRAALRRAIIAREVLGPPKALREEDGFA